MGRMSARGAKVSVAAVRGRTVPVLCAAAAVVMAACSVSTPRHGFTAGRGSTGLQAGAAGAGNGPGAGGAGGDTAGAQVAASTGAGPVGATGGGPAGRASAAVGSRGGTAVGVSGGGGGSTGAGAPGGGPVVGVTKDTITISAIAGFSGNYGAILTEIYDNGFGTWLDDVNAHGGIYGRKVVAKKVDNHDTVEGGVSACKEIQNNGSYLAVSIVGFGGADVSAADCLERAGITTLGLNLSAFSPSWHRVFSAGDATKQTRPLASYIRDVIGDHGKIAVFHTDDPLNTAARGGLVAEMQRLGMNLVHEETVAPNQSSFVAELTRTRDSGATTVALVVNTNEVLGILRDGKTLGYQPNWTGTYWDIDENTAAARALFEGVKALRNYSSTNSPAFATYSSKAKATGHGSVVNSTNMALYGIGLLVGQVLQNTGPNPTVEGLPAAIEKILNYNNQVTMALSFGPSVRVAEVGMWPIQCCNSDNTWQGIGDAKTAF